MNERSPTIGELLAHPKVQGLVSQEDAERIAASLGKSEQASKDPMYIRILSGIGAWFAAVFLILFLVISHMLESGTGGIICGIIFLVAAIIIARASKAAFLSQLSLALAFAGNILVLRGAAVEFGSHDISVVLITHAVVCTVVYTLYANSIYRFLARWCWWHSRLRGLSRRRYLFLCTCLLAQRRFSQAYCSCARNVLPCSRPWSIQQQPCCPQRFSS